ncbi:MAG: carboxypeptidase-like regulatory domain-containing protein [Balneolaceae bacterium]
MYRFFNKLLPIIISLLILFIGELHAQNSSLQGIITDHSTGEALFGANVLLQSIGNEDLMHGAATGGDGYFRIGSIQAGTYSFRVSYIGYVTVTDTLTFSSSEDRTFNITLETDESTLGELVVSRTTIATQRIEGAQRISAREISRVPSPASGDLTAYLQTLPGVVTTGDRGGQVFIRGGSPSENMVLIDGALIYQPSHIVGFFSPIPGDLIAGADFYAGGFGPKFTGRISSVMDVQLRHGDLYNTSASSSISPFAADVFAEGPIVKGLSSWVLSARNSLIESTSSWYPIESQPLKFQSQFFKTSYIQDDTRCSGMILHTYDRGRMDFDTDESIQWRNFVMGGRCVALPEGSSTFMTTNVYFSRFSNSLKDSGPFGFKSSAMRLNLDIDLRQYAGNVRFDYGAFSRLKFLSYDLGEKFAGFNLESSSQFLMGGHVQASVPIGGKLDIHPGLGFSYNGDFGLGLEPRFRFSWRPFGRESEEFSGSAGLYLQPLTGISDIRDVSSVFVAWMSAPISDSQLESFHTTIGWQQIVTNGLTWSVEAYYKEMNNLAIPVWNTIAEFTTDLALANGKVYGSDFRIEYNRGKIYGLIGYGYNWTLYESAQDHFSIWFGEPVQDFHPPHDRRHQLNALFSFDSGVYTTGIRWQMGSGLPFTQPLGFDDVLDFRERLPSVNRDRGIRRVILDKPFQGRMPTIHRLDISIERSFQISASGSNLNVQAGAINIYDQSNIFFYDIYTSRRIDQLSFSPYLTLKLEVK